MARIEQGSQEWLDLRRTKIGASDAGAIMGISPWKTTYQLWLEKTGRIAGEKENDAMRRGKALEEEAREFFGNFLDIVFFDDVKVYEDFGLNFMMASLDGIDLDKKVAIEIKCPTSKQNHIEYTKGNIPEHYLAQMQHQMFVYGLKSMFFGSYFPGETCILQTIYARDSFLTDYLIKCENFWHENIFKDIPPPMTDKDFEYRDDVRFWERASDWIGAKRRLKRAQLDEEEFKESLLSVCDRNCTDGSIKCQKITRKGNIDYENIPELKDVDLEPYRKESSEYWKVSMEEENEKHIDKFPVE